jgi:hypothetical protein
MPPSLGFPQPTCYARLDGLYGDAAPLIDVLTTGRGRACAARRAYHLLELEGVKLQLLRTPDQVSTHEDKWDDARTLRLPRRAFNHCWTRGATGASLLMAPCPLLALRRRRAGRGSLRALCQHPSHPSVYRLGCAGSVPPSRLVCAPCWPMKTMNRNLTAGTEHYPLREGGLLKSWRSRVWNLRLELGQTFSPVFAMHAPLLLLPMSPSRFTRTSLRSWRRTWLKARQYLRQCMDLPNGPVLPLLMARLRSAFTGASVTCPLLCQALHPLYPQERRPERAWFGCRVLYAARIGHCRA